MTGEGADVQAVPGTRDNERNLAYVGLALAVSRKEGKRESNRGIESAREETVKGRKILETKEWRNNGERESETR